MSALSTRAPAARDAARIAALLTRCGEADGRGAVDEATVRLWFADPSLDLAADFRIAERGDALVGYVDVAPNDVLTRLNIDVRIDPDERPAGAVGRALLDAAEQRALARAAAWPARDEPPILRAYAFAADAAWESLLTGRGYRAVRNEYEMRITLDQPLPPPRWPDGIAVCSLREGEERRLFDAEQEGFADHWGFAPSVYERWLHHARLATDEDRAFCFLALDGGEIAGVARCRRESGGTPGLGWVDSLAVRPRWRRRGIALALLHHAFGAIRASGQPRAGLGVDAQSETGALELYERAGMHVHARSTAYDRALDD